MLKKNYLYILVIAISFGCNLKDKSIDIYSYQIKNKANKINILQKYLTKSSGIIDAEYHIWIKDNSTGIISGPSDYTIRVALKIQPDSINSWLHQLQRSNKLISNNKWTDLKLDKNVWSLNSEPEFYHSGLMKEVKLVYRKDNIILGVYSTIPINLDLKE